MSDIKADISKLRGQIAQANEDKKSKKRGVNFNFKESRSEIRLLQKGMDTVHMTYDV